MNQGHVLQSSPYQHMMTSGNPNWWSINNNMRPPSTTTSTTTPFIPSPSTIVFPHYSQPPLPPSTTTTNSSSTSSPSSSSSSLTHASWQVHHNQEPQNLESMSQVLIGRPDVGDDQDNKGLSMMSLLLQGRKFESNWEEPFLLSSHQATSVTPSHNDTLEFFKQENPTINYFYNGSHEHLQASKPITNYFPPPLMIPVVSSPKSSVLGNLSNHNMLDFASDKEDVKHPIQDRSFDQCNNSGGTLKKARVQSSSIQSTTLKVRKEKLGDRITALHQLVSPFGKTDTASVLSEAIGYIRFLQSQIEALSLPYLSSESSNNMSHQQSLLSDNCTKRKRASDQQEYNNEEQKKDLRSRGLCLVPVSYTLQVGNDNGADYWAHAFGGLQ